MALRDLVSRNVPTKRADVSHPLWRLQENFNRMFDEFFNNFNLEPFESRILGKFPSVDIKESDKTVTVSAELPGLEAKDIDISISDDVLNLRGQKEEESESKEGNYYHKERTYGSFQRDIPLPAEVEFNDVNAVFKNGVLTITIPKKPEDKRKSKKIEIKAG